MGDGPAASETRRRPPIADYGFLSDCHSAALVDRRGSDGSIGLGGDPVRLLKRIGQLLAADGSALVELAGPGVGTVHEQVRLRVGDRMSSPFSRATLGVDTIEPLPARPAS